MTTHAKRASWNYRVVHFAKDESEAWQICEVYYGADGKPHGYCDATPMATEADHEEKGYAESLRWSLGKMLEALDKPVLEAEDFGVPRQNNAP